MTVPHHDFAKSLPKPKGGALYRGPMGGILMRPWFDGVCLASICRWLFPLLRGLAAAHAAEGDLDRFWRASGLAGKATWRPEGRLRRFLADQADREHAHEAAQAAWQAAFFESDDNSPKDLVGIEVARRRASAGLFHGAWPLVPYLTKLDVLRCEVTPPEEVIASLPEIVDSQVLYPLSEMPPVVRSPAIGSSYGRESWLQFTSPALGDRVSARLYESVESVDPPSFVFLHGIGMEPEHWPEQPDAINRLTAQGFRVIRPEAPWHGRRRWPGWFGGEPVMGRGPQGMLELFQAWICEVSVLLRWARETSKGPVVLGGVSLGALTSQRYAVAAKDWPAALQPDGLFLVATSENLTDIAYSGSLVAGVGLTPKLRASGWHEEDLAPILPWLEPRGAPCLPPERIIMVLGDKDTVTPFAGGKSLARRWRVPDQNLFIRHQGHFTLCIGLGHRPEPLHRLDALVTEAIGSEAAS